MATVNALSLNSNGESAPVQVRRTAAQQWFFKTRSRLYVHYESARLGIVMLSATHPDRLMSSSTALFTFPLPPPLNAYLYPDNLIVAAIDADQAPKNLEAVVFSDLCKGLIACASMQSFGVDLTHALYDVPAMPMLNVEDDLESYFEEEEEEEGENYDSAPESEDLDDDEAWDEEDSVM